jgi:NodT family efflux transporter outer membrane factor (OMF) lipoprotein
MRWTDLLARRPGLKMPIALWLLTLAGCAAGPDYVRPVVTPPAAYKEAQGDQAAGVPWQSAQPQVVDAHRPWWEGYGDATLNDLVTQANAASLDIRVAEARYRQAQAAVQAARANYFPQVGASVSVGQGRSLSSKYLVTGNDSAGLSASWEPDLWGRVSRSVEASAASAQASAADLAAARLSIQAALVQDYLQLRISDVQSDLLNRTVQDYAKAYSLTRSQREAGVATGADVALAEAQLKSTQAQAIDLGVQRSQLEHAIALLLGKSPAEFSLARVGGDALSLTLPAAPLGLPSALLQRRPDIAGAERRAAAANASIGVAQSAYFPNLLLSAGGGYASTSLASLFEAPSRVWSLGAALAGTLFDGGARRAQTAQAQAAYDAAAAQYKETVLAGFQDVEDNLAALRILADERAVQDQAVAAARRALQSTLAQYREGTGTYLAVVTSQTLALTNQRTAVQLLGRQLVASAALVKALGGGWDVTQLAGP